MTMNDDEQEDVESDMTPMIDIIFLLLIFFLLTTTFIPEEKVVASLLPTDKGQRTDTPIVNPPQQVNVLIYPYDRHDPAAYARGAGGVQYFHQRWTTDPVVRDATLRIGNGDTVCRLRGDLLSRAGGDRQMIGHVRTVHAYLAQELAHADGGHKRADRAQMDPIVIHCFSGLPWKYALVAYDGVRAYEAAHASGERASDLLTAREVAFAPPRLRAYHEWEVGKELNEIILMN